MVRLRSDRWYSKQGQSRVSRQVATQSTAGRRLFSLVLMFGLVIMMMQKAADPAVYSKAFKALGVPLDTVSRQPVPNDDTANAEVGLAVGGDSVTGLSPALSLPSLIESFNLKRPFGVNPAIEANLTAARSIGLSPWQQFCSDAWGEMVSSISESQLKKVAEASFCVAPAISTAGGTTDPNLADSDLATLSEKVAIANQMQGAWDQFRGNAWDAMTESERSDWKDRLDQFATNWKFAAGLESDPESKSDRSGESNDFDLQAFVELRQSFVQAVDRRLQATIKDAQPWRPEERIAFLRALQRGVWANHISSDDAKLNELPLVDYNALAEQKDAYRGRWVRFRGTVRRVEKIQSQGEAWGVADYFVLWIQPEDGSPNPVAAFLAGLSAAEAEILGGVVEGDANTAPEAEVTAVLTKRLAYKSGIGVEVAPALVGGTVKLAAAASSKGASAEAAWTTWTWVQIIGGALAVATLLILWIGSGITRPARLAKVVFWFVALSGSWIACCETGQAFQGQAFQEQAFQEQAFQEQAFPTTDKPLPWRKGESGDANSGQAVAGILDSILSPQDSADIRGAIQDRSTSVPPASLTRLMFQMNRLGAKAVASTIPASLTESEGAQPETANSSQDSGAGGSVDSADTADLASTNRVWRPVRLSGWVTEVSPWTLGEAAAISLDRPKIWRIRVQPDPASQQASDVVCLDIPSLWQQSKPLNQFCRVEGIAIDSLAGDPNGDQAAGLSKPNVTDDCIVASHLRWTIPASRTEVLTDKPVFDLAQLESLQPSLPASWVQLAQCELDLMALDRGRRFQNFPLQASETQTFYHLLHAANCVPELGNFQSVKSLLSQPADRIGLPTKLNCRLARATRVEITDPESQRLAGADHYFQIDGFWVFDGLRIEIKPPPVSSSADEKSQAIAAAAKPIVYEGEFPITVVMRELPGWLAKQADRNSAAGATVLDLRGQQTDCEAIFYRMWSYESEFVNDRDSRQRQSAPLLFATSLTESTWKPSTAKGGVEYLSWLLAFAMLAVLGVMWRVYLTDNKRSKRQTDSRTKQR